jgi:guanylate kinase
VSAIVSYDDRSPTPRAEVALANGEHVVLEIERRGLRIARVAHAGPAVTLFAAAPPVVAELCTALVDVRTAPDPTPLRLLTTMVARLPSATEVTRTFTAAAAALG